MKLIITSIFIFLIHFNTNAQRPYPENQKFEFDSLMILSNDTFNITLAQYVEINNTSSNNYILPANAKWKLKYYRYFGWYSIVGGPGENFNYLYKSKSDFIIRSSEWLKSKFDFNANPEHGINWKAKLINQNTLVISWSHSYPNGNMTSWDYSKYYFFERVY